jgi:GTPase involved in cell partitioning and DNA repair
MLLHLVAPPDEDADRGDPEHYLYAFELVNAELRAYSGGIAGKPQVAALTKTDLLTPEQVRGLAEAFRLRGIALHALSASRGDGLDKLRENLQAELLGLRPPAPKDETGA